MEQAGQLDQVSVQVVVLVGARDVFDKWISTKNELPEI